MKSVTPNMKKKKDASFDDLKNKVIKPLKTLPIAIKDYLTVVAAHWKDQVPQEFCDAAKLGGDESFFKTLSSSPDVLKFTQGQRISQANKEHKGVVDRFRDMSDKLSKRYQALAALKGFNP